MNISVALKLTVARFLNSSLILVIVNSDSTYWFTGGNLAYDASVLVGVLAFQTPIMELIGIPTLVKKIKICLQKNKGEDCKMTQREANILCEGPQIDVANKISNFMNMVMTCMFYSPLIPQAIPLAFVSSFLTYWTTKYNLLRRHKMPDMFSELMATFFANVLPWFMLVWALSYFFFFNEAKDLARRRAELMSEENVIGYAYYTIVFAFICILCPIRTCIQLNLKDA